MQPNRQIFEYLLRLSYSRIESYASRSYYTNTHNKQSLYSKISPLGSPSVTLTPELDDWVNNGNKVRFSELQRIVLDLRKRRRFSQALEVLEWMNEKGNFAFSPTEHAVRLDLIGKVHGSALAENYFSNLKDGDKTHKTYGALLHCYVRQRQADKSVAHLKKMKEMGFASSALTYNDIMCLYANIGEIEKVPDVLVEMKRSGVQPDNLSYRICINSYGVRSNFEEIEKILKEMESQPHITMDWNTYAVVANFYLKKGLKEKANDALKKAEERLDGKDGLGFNHLISLHSQMGNKDDVLRLWALEKTSCNRCINRDYVNMLESLVRLGELEEAEKLLKDWDLSGNCYDFRVPNVVIVGYSERKLYEKAEAMLEELKEKGLSSTSNSWGQVASGYMDKGEIEKAVACMGVALSLYGRDEGWKPNPNVISRMLCYLSEKGRIEEAKGFISLLKDIVPVDREMYHAMLRACTRAGKDASKILDDMKANKIDADDETKILSKS